MPHSLQKAGNVYGSDRVEHCNVIQRERTVGCESAYEKAGIEFRTGAASGKADDVACTLRMRVFFQTEEKQGGTAEHFVPIQAMCSAFFSVIRKVQDPVFYGTS